MGLGQACRRKAGRQQVGVGAKSLNRDLSDVHTWPNSHYLMRQCAEVGGWGKVQLKYRLCWCRCKIDDLMREERGISLSFIIDRLPGFAPYPAPRSARSFSSHPAQLRSTYPAQILPRDCRLPNPFPA